MHGSSDSLATADAEDVQSWEFLRNHPEFAETFDEDSRPDSDADDATDTESVALSAYAFFVHPHPVITASAGSSLPPPMPVTPDSDFIPSFDCDLTSALRSLIDDRQSQSAHLHLNPTFVEALVWSK